jgi:hypothetical protein
MFMRRACRALPLAILEHRGVLVDAADPRSAGTIGVATTLEQAQPRLGAQAIFGNMDHRLDELVDGEEVC